LLIDTNLLVKIPPESTGDTYVSGILGFDKSSWSSLLVNPYRVASDAGLAAADFKDTLLPSENGI